MCSSINQTLFSVVLKTASSYCKRILNVKSKRIECFVGIEFRRTFTATKYRSARRIKQSFITPYNETNYTSSKREPNDFGKIISLDPSEVEEDCERRPLGNKKSKKKLDKSTLRKIELKEKDFNADSVFEDRVPKNNDDGELKDTNKIKSKSSQNNQSKELQYKSIKNHESLLCSTIISLKSRKHRTKEKKIIVEGKRLIHDALSSGCKPLMIFFSNPSDLENLNLPEGIKLYKTSYKSLQLWSNVVTSQGILAVFQMPSFDSKSIEASSTIPLTVICDNIREPGNLGSVLRVVAGVGCKKLILTKGCADIWDLKVLRSGAGAHFRLPLLINLDWKEIENEVGETDQIILADNELPPAECKTSGEKNDEKERSENFRNKSMIDWDLPLHVYNFFDYSNSNNVLVIGGETHGLSESAHRFAVERRGIKVCIPMCNKIESLNTAVALGIIAYEVRRQTDFLPKDRFSDKSDEVLSIREEQSLSS